MMMLEDDTHNIEKEKEKVWDWTDMQEMRVCLFCK